MKCTNCEDTAFEQRNGFTVPCRACNPNSVLRLKREKFFPGPWRATDRTVSSVLNDRIIAECGQSTSVEMDQATAKLVSAAPELLACLKVCWEYCQANGVENYSWAERIRKAIEQAEGGQDEEEDQ